MKKIIIIGGGIAGMSAGIFAQKNGFESVILEKNPVPGGECTGWDRKGYHIDGCIHWLAGTKPGTPLNALWQTVGALDGAEIFEPEDFLSFEYNDISINFYRDLDKLKSSWLAISPDDKKAIEEFVRMIRQLHTMEVPVDKPADMMNPLEKIKMLASMKDVGMVLQKYAKVSLPEYARAFKHPALREALTSFLPEGYSSVALFFGLAAFTKGDANVPRGGSRAMALRMAERYKELGGLLEAPCEVVDLEISHNRATKVVCKNGKTFEADYIIAACDAKVLFAGLLKGRYNDPAYEMRYSNPNTYPLASQLQVSLGYAGTVGNLPRTIFMQSEPIKYGATEIDRFKLTHFGHEPGYAPDGHTALHAIVNQFAEDYEVWSKFYNDKEAYRNEKERIGQEVLEAIENRFPEMSGKLEVFDVATPKTYERYCKAHRGAFMPFMMTTGGKMLDHSGRIKGLKNLYLSGQWLQPPGGLPTAAITGKDTIMRICKQEKQPFAPWR
jgi:phytoene dehydrogenase-like protein